MKKSNKKSTQTDGSGGAKMSVENKIETKMQIEALKKIHKILCQRRIELENVPCAIDMRFVISRRNFAKNMQNLAFQ